MRRLFLGIVAICATVPAAATDLPFGGDTLPYLIRSSDLTLRGHIGPSLSAAFGPSDNRYMVHSIIITSSLRGERLVSERLSFGVHSSIPVQDRRPGEVIVFLKRLNGPTAQALRATDTQYVSVSGGYGVINVSQERSEAISSLVAAGNEPSRKEDWARRYLTSSDMLLQRSSLHLAHDDIAEAWARRFLLGALGNSAVSLVNRRLAMEMLIDGDVPGAAEALQRVADNASAPTFLRDAASRLLSRPGSER